MSDKPETTILNVDDDDASRYAVSRTLRQAGFEVMEAANGAEALRLVRENPDLIVLDVHLPDMSGFEICRRIRVDPATSLLPILMISATYRDSQSMVMGLDHGADGYLTHPVEPLVLIATVNALLRVRQAQEALRESEKRLSTIFAASPDCIYLSDTQGRVLDANPTLLELVGLSLEQIQERNILDFFAGDDPSELLQAVSRLQAGEGVRGLEVKAKLATGEIRDYEIHAIPLRESGVVTAILSVARDVTERKRAEEALRESEKKYRQLIENLNEGIWVIDQDAYTTFANPRMAEMLGYTVEEMQGKHLFSFMDECGVEIAKHNLERRRQGIKEQHDFEFLRKDGTRIYTRLETSPITDDDGNYIGAIAGVMDITERKRAEDALQEYSERLEDMVDERTRELRDAQEELIRKERLATLGQLAGGVAHELRNPLAVIINAVYYLQITLPDADESTKEYLEIINDEVRGATMILTDLLDFSRIRFPERGKIAVSGLVATVLKKRPPPESVEVIAEIPSDLPPVYVDPWHIDQVLANLVDNACQAMKNEGGVLTISAQAEEGRVALSVADTGAGIPEENMTRIFEPLFTTKARGIGLGLTISKQLAEANESSIEVESEEGKGSTFTVKLPVYGEEQKA